MSKAAERKLVVGLDIGTSKISVAVGEITPDNQLSIIGVGNQPARGMDKGGVNDLNLVIQAIQRAINEAELMADCQISSIYLGISGKHISCQNENGMVPVNDKEVIQEDVDNVIHTHVLYLFQLNVVCCMCFHKNTALIVKTVLKAQ